MEATEFAQYGTFVVAQRTNLTLLRTIANELEPDVEAMFTQTVGSHIERAEEILYPLEEIVTRALTGQYDEQSLQALKVGCDDLVHAVNQVQARVTAFIRRDSTTTHPVPKTGPFTY